MMKFVLGLVRDFTLSLVIVGIGGLIGIQALLGFPYPHLAALLLPVMFGMALSVESLIRSLPQDKDGNLITPVEQSSN